MAKKLATDHKAAQEKLAAQEKAAKAAAGTIESAKKAITRAEQDQQTFDAHAERLTAAVQTAQDELRAFQETYSQQKLQLTTK